MEVAGLFAGDGAAVAGADRVNKNQVGQVEQLTVRSSSERVAQFLLKLARDGAESAIVHLPYDKGLIAARLGMQP